MNAKTKRFFMWFFGIVLVLIIALKVINGVSDGFSWPTDIMSWISFLAPYIAIICAFIVVACSKSKGD